MTGGSSTISSHKENLSSNLNRRRRTRFFHLCGCWGLSPEYSSMGSRCTWVSTRSISTLESQKGCKNCQEFTTISVGETGTWKELLSIRSWETCLPGGRGIWWEAHYASSRWTYSTLWDTRWRPEYLFWQLRCRSTRYNNAFAFWSRWHGNLDIEDGSRPWQATAVNCEPAP